MPHNAQRKTFNRLARSFTVLAAGFLFSAQAGAQTAPKKVAASNDSSVVVIYQATSKASRVMNANTPLPPVQELTAELARTTDGADLLAYARQQGVTIAYKKNMRRDEKRYGYCEFKTTTVYIDPDMTMGDRLMAASHELWHMRQAGSLQFLDMNARFLKPDQLWAMWMLDEADAFSYGAYFMAKREKDLGQKDSLLQLEAFRPMMDALRVKMDAPGGLGMNDYRDIALAHCYTILESKQYWSQMRGRINEYLRGMACDVVEMEQEADKNGTSGIQMQLADYRRKFATTPDDAEFEKFLRGFGGVRIDTLAKTALQDSTVSFEALIHQYPYLPSGDGDDAERSITDIVNFMNEKNATFDDMKQRVQKLSAQPPRQVAVVTFPPR